MVALALAVIFGERRSFHKHSVSLIRGLKPPLKVLGEQYIPHCGPGVILANHYSSPTFWIPWLVAAVTAAVDQEIYWTMTGSFKYSGQIMRDRKQKLSQWLLGKVARVYGFNTMPPMPPAPHEVTVRAQSVLRIIAHAREHPEQLIGLVPEGSDQAGGVMSLPPEGAGRLGIALASPGLLFSPVGVYEETGELCVCFGQPFRLDVPTANDRAAVDYAAREKIAHEIARCLPDRLRGGW